MSFEIHSLSLIVNHSLRAFILLFPIFYLTPSVAHSADWSIQSDFESFALGSLGEGESGFTTAFTNNVITDEYVEEGVRSSRTSVAAGCTCFGAWGGEINFPDLSQGDEIWLRVYFYFPPNFDFSATGVGLKALRLHRKSAAGDNEGYIDVLIRNGLVIGNEVQWPDYVIKNVGSTVPRGQWHALELYVKLHSSPNQGAIRVWQDGELVYENLSTETLKSSSSVMDLFYLFSYWNGGSPTAQSAYVDEIIISAAVPSQRDASGTPFIGLGSAEPRPPELRPMPPSLTVE